MKKYNHVSEKMLVKTLKYILSCSDFKIQAKESSKKKKKKKSKKSSGNLDKEIETIQNSNQHFPNVNILANQNSSTNYVDLLNSVLSCSFDPKMIVKYLRQDIDLNDLLVIMDFLYEKIKEESFDCTDSGKTIAVTPAELDDFDLDGKLFEWFTLLIDSHYQQILLSKDEILLKKLVEWNELVKNYVCLIEEMMEVRALLLTVVKGKYKLDSGKSSNKWYSVETVKLY